MDVAADAGGGRRDAGIVAGFLAAGVDGRRGGVLLGRRGAGPGGGGGPVTITGGAMYAGGSRAITVTGSTAWTADQ